MTDLPIRFNPARIIQYKRRLLPWFFERPERAGALDIAGEEPTPRFAFTFLLLFVFFSYAQLGTWLPGHAAPFTSEVPTGAAWLAAKLRLSFTPAVLALLGIIVYKGSRGERFLFPRPQALIMALFIGCAFLSVPFSLHPSRSLDFALSNMMKLFLLFLLTINVVRNVRSFKAFLWAVALSGCIPATGALLANFFPEQFALYEHPSGRMGWAGHFLNPNIIASAMCMLVPVGLCLVELSASSAKKAFAFGLVGLYAFTMLKMLSRVSMISLVVIGAIYVASSKNKVRNLLIAAVLGVAAVAAVPAVVARAKTIAAYRQDASAMGRIHLWKAGISMAMKRPLSGMGVDCFNIATAQHFPLYTEEKRLRWRSPHSSYIEVLAEMGFPGLGVFLALVGVTVADARRLHKRLQNVPEPGAQELARMSRAILLALIAVSVVGLTGHHAYDWLLHMFIALTVCLKQMALRYDALA